MTLYTTLDCRMQEKWIHTNIWKGNNHITSGTWCSHNKMFPQLDSTESRRHKLCQIDPTRHQNDILSRVLLASVDPVSTFCHHTMSTKSTINYTTFSFGIIKKKRKKGKENTLPVFCISYSFLFLALHILRLSATSQMGHKPMFWRPALLPSSGSMQ